MRFFADLHVHSKFARATSGDLDLEHMALWAAKKGVGVLGTGDFTHPGWLAEIREKLLPAEPGLFRLKPELERWCAERFPPFASQPTRFLLQVEISTIYKKGDKTRKVHHCHYMPDLAAAERFIARLARIGNLNADGRPILGLDSRHLLEITLEAGDGAFLIPAHIWTPWFAVLGSKSGFDTIADCYGDLTPHLFAMETGLSSDPPMNWRLSQLDRYTLVSNSDAHSPGKIGREACAFDCELSYWAMREALRTGAGYGGTVEFFPEEGKYHLDGHRACGIRFEPGDTKKHGGLCPVCGRGLTVGVMHRVDELADRADGTQPTRTTPFHSLVPLPEVLGEIHRVGPASRKVADHYEKLLHTLGSELFILERAPLDELQRAGSDLLAEGIRRMRAGEVIRHAGYDGEYGVIRVFHEEELTRDASVSLLFELPAASRKPPGVSQDARRNEAAASPAGQPALAFSEEAPPFAATRSESSASSQPPAHFPSHFQPPERAPLADDLDADQRAAVEIASGPLLIIAGPGTGKTRTLTHRLARLVTDCGAAPEHLLAVTFTNRAANEMRERLEKLLPRGGAGPAAPLVTTFHGLGYRLLREFGSRLGLSESPRIASEPERRALLVQKLKLTESRADSLLRKLSTWKRTGETPDAEAALALKTYDAALRANGWLDFDDLITLTVELLEAHSDTLARCRERYRHVSVDEFQDLDARQYRLLRLLVPADGNLCVIGDPDQAIYRFRGGEPRFFEEFARDYPAAREVRLTRNYRSSRAIVSGALQAIAPSSLVEGRVLEALRADAATRIAIHEAASDKAEAEFVVHSIERLIGGSGFFALDSGRVDSAAHAGNFSFADFAVLYRTDAQADVIGAALARAGIPFQRHSHQPLVAHASMQALLALAAKLPAASPLLERLRSAAAVVAKQDAAVPQWLLALEPLAARCDNDLARFESELALGLDLDLHDARADRVSLLTLHASKGLEFPIVFLAGCEDGLLPLRFGADDDADLAEERRLFFVGMTRARERLFLTHARRRFWRGQMREQRISPLITSIQRELLERSQAPAFKPKPKDAQLDLFA
ncbi:MAG: UvrD-helicase domain-containing protein [Verrucomicrobiae bacterium]|nr:UvrD-helicase domain-containing protein [Verrucomicrobiae bacterium]